MAPWSPTCCSCPRWTPLWSQSWTSGSYFIQGNRWIQSAECLRRALDITTQVWEELTWFRRMWTLFSLSLSSFTTPGLQSLEGWIVHNMLKTVTSRALLVAVAIASVAELKRKETANLKPDIDVIIAKWSPDVSLSCSARISVTQKSDHSSCPAASGRRSAWWRFLPSTGVLSSS